MTNDDVSITTKEKILEVANDLFAADGFYETSVRQIAAKAGVNLAAINYHFKNKGNLYRKVFEYNYNLIEVGVQNSGKNAKTTEELAIKVYRFFIANESAMMNTFKIFLSDVLVVPDDHEEKFGPPGQDVFLDRLEQDIGTGYPEESKKWAIKMIFSLIVHHGVIMNTPLMKKKCKLSDEFSVKNVENFLRHSIRAHLMYLKENPKLSTKSK